MNKPRLLVLALGMVSASACQAATASLMRVVVVDPLTSLPVAARITLSSPNPHIQPLVAAVPIEGLLVDAHTMSLGIQSSGNASSTVLVPLGTSSVIQAGQDQERPIKEITIRVTAPLIRAKQAVHEGQSTVRTSNDIKTFSGSIGAGANSLTNGQKGVAEDSGGQQHVRGEHAEIAYVVDGVPLPDTLSGRQGSIVVPSTIDSLEMLTGGYAPEFGGQTAAVLNIATLPGAKKASNLFSLQAGSFNALNTELTSQGPIGSRTSYVFDIGETSSSNALEPQQPNYQTAHNGGFSESYFGKLKYLLSPKDDLTLTLSNNPDALQIGNRAGLPSSFAQAGQGYGFLGLRDANGVESGLNGSNAGLLGSATMPLGSQQADHMDINQHEVSEFATLQYHRRVGDNDSAQIAITALHSGQTVDNNNVHFDAQTLFTQHVDNSVEYDPSSTRNVHHLQGEGSYQAVRGNHKLKAGFLVDAQTGHETYNIQAESQLALDELHVVAPNLCPVGHLTGAMDVLGNPVYVATSSAYPTVSLSRVGSYKAGYIQDTWQISKRFSANYGLRVDAYTQNQSLGQSSVSDVVYSPRFNFSYKLSKQDDVRWSYDKLFDTPPLAQGAIVGQPIQPETLNQYDISIEHRLPHGQTISLGYYYKDIRNQVDTGLLIPGSEIGLYSAVNFQVGAVHGTEFSYNIAPAGGVGWDAFVNGTYSVASPNGNDSTGAAAPTYNDHDQRETVGTGLAYQWKSGASAALTFDYGSGLASSVVPPNTSRTSRTQTDLHMTTGDHLFGGKGGLGLDVTNLFDSRNVINFQSAFSGTRFQLGRSILISAFCKF